MKGLNVPYAFFLTLLILFNAAYLAVPFVAMSSPDGSPELYAAFGPTCHQLASRSLCVFRSSGGSLSVGDCFPSSGFSPSRANIVEQEGRVGYKIPVCSRDVAIYLSMLAGLLVLPLVRKAASDEWPNKWLLVAAAVPTAIDGTSQLFGLRESTNLLRIITGAIIGFALPFYILPMLNSLYAAIRGKWEKKKR